MGDLSGRSTATRHGRAALTSSMTVFRARGTRCELWSASVCVILLLGTIAHAASPIDPNASSFGKLIETLKASDLNIRRQFTQLALSTLIEANRVEIQRAHQLGSPMSSATRWEVGAATYVSHLEQFAATIPTAQEIEIVTEPYGAVRLSIDHAQVILSAPRLSLQQEFERTILLAGCEIVTCEDSSSTLAAAVAAQSLGVRREWSFSDQGPPLLSASDGLHCVFLDNRHLRLKEAACDALMQELRLAAEGLRAVIQHGGGVDWNAFKIVQAAAGESQQVVVDRSGTTFDLDLPYLGTDETVWRGAIPWLQARLRGYNANYMIKVPERMAYLPPGVEPDQSE